MLFSRHYIKQSCISIVVPLADGMDCRDIREEVMVFSFIQSLPQILTAFEMLHQDAQAVQVRVLGRHNLKNDLNECTERYLRKKRGELHFVNR